MSGLHPFGGRVSRHFSDSLAPEDAYLSYFDVRLTCEDVDCIKHDWLTDNAISFWEEYLEHEKLVDYPRAKIVLLRPTMAFMLLNTPDPASLKSALPDFSNTTHIFLPVNDNTDPSHAEGGSHWSLLLVSISDHVAFHYDSMHPHNADVAAALTKSFSRLLGLNLSFRDLSDSPQQSNGNDCGVFVCLTMQELLLGKLLTARADNRVNMSMAGEKVDASRGRKAMLQIIESFRREGEKRRSSSHSRRRSRNSKSRSPPRIGEENSPRR